MQYQPRTYEDLKAMPEKHRNELRKILQEVKNTYTSEEQRAIDMDIEKIQAIELLKKNNLA